MTAPRLSAFNSLLLVIDIQDKLLVTMPDAADLVRDAAFLIDVAQLLQIPVMATEQYPKGLGPTTAELARRLPAQLPAKRTFSCCGAPGLLAEIRASGRENIVLAGMETHVCVMQTALDLLAEGSNVFLPVNAIRARFRIDHEMALDRMRTASAVLTTVEAAAFEWLGGAEHPRFKAASKLIQERRALCGG